MGDIANAVSGTSETINPELIEKLTNYASKKNQGKKYKEKPWRVHMQKRRGNEEILLHTLRNMGGGATFDELAFEMGLERSRVAGAVLSLARSDKIIAEVDKSDDWIIRLPNNDEREDWMRLGAKGIGKPETKMDDELRDALRELDAENTIDRDDGEFTIVDAVGIWAESRSGTQKKANRLVEEGKLTVRRVYDPECKNKVNAYKKV